MARVVSYFGFGVLLVAALLGGAVCSTATAGDGQVLHVGETTTLSLDGGGWRLDPSASRQAQLVSVKNANGTGASRYVLKGLKAGQAKLVFRSGQKTYNAHIDVLN